MDQEQSHQDPAGQHADRDPSRQEEPLDAANQSLADALRASFGILKVIMMVLVVLYLFSNVRCIEGHEQALVLRLGRLLPKVHDAGQVWALPFPIDALLLLPTRKSNDLLVTSHSFHRRRDEIGKPLSFIHRGPHQGLHPTLDGALITSDSGLVHLQWKVKYKFDDVSSYVREIYGDRVEDAENLIRTFVETVGIQIASGLTAEEMIRTRVDYVQAEMKKRINERLSALDSGIAIERIDVHEPTPPLQIRSVFDDTQRAENARQLIIRSAEQERIKILSDAAGAAHLRLIRLLNRIDRGGTRERSLEQLQAQLDRMLEDEVEGRAGELIKNASAYHAIVVGRIQSDVDLYRALLPEYKRNPALLIGRLWEKTRQEIFESPGVTKIVGLHDGLQQFRLKIPLDPEQTRHQEEERIQKRKFDVKTLRPERYHPIGPEYD